MTEPAQRILVTGNAGAGKTTLALLLGAELGLPVRGLDAIVWRRGWRKAPAAEKREAIEEIARRRAWIVDGVSTEVEAAADLILFLDSSPLRCLARCVARAVRAPLRTRPELPAGCPELRIVPRVPGIVWRFHRRFRPGLLERARGEPARYRRVPVPVDLADVLAALTTDAGPAPVARRRPALEGAEGEGFEPSIRR